MKAYRVTTGTDEVEKVIAQANKFNRNKNLVLALKGPLDTTNGYKDTVIFYVVMAELGAWEVYTGMLGLSDTFDVEEVEL